MRFLITNDDGFDAPGLKALHHVLTAMGEVTAVAPPIGHSCRGHGVTDHDPILVRRESMEDIGEIWVVEGTPADCVRIGLLELMKAPPDMVLAGINRGANLGVDVYYSGTVAAAREAAILGRPAAAISQYVKKGIQTNWEWAECMAAAVLRRLLREPPLTGCLWNVNLPVLPLGTWPASLAFVPTSIDGQNVRFRDDDPPHGRGRAYRFAGRYADRPARQDTDVHLVFSGHATATMLQLQTATAFTVRCEPFPVPKDDESSTRGNLTR